ncbi:hypothetical protein EMIT0210MI2_10222 [Priestia megaterium]
MGNLADVLKKKRINPKKEVGTKVFDEVKNEPLIKMFD